MLSAPKTQRELPILTLLFLIRRKVTPRVVLILKLLSIRLFVLRLPVIRVILPVVRQSVLFAVRWRAQETWRPISQRLTRLRVRRCRLLVKGPSRGSVPWVFRLLVVNIMMNII